MRSSNFHQRTAIMLDQRFQVFAVDFRVILTRNAPRPSDFRTSSRIPVDDLKASTDENRDISISRPSNGAVRQVR